MNTTLGTYTIRLYDSKLGNDIDIENNEYSISVKMILKNFLLKLKENKKKDEEEKKISFVSKFEENDDIFEGIIKSGSYGFTSEILDTDNDEVSYNKKKNEAEVLPFYFKISLKRYRVDQYYLILQRLGVLGIKSHLEKELNRYFRIHNQNFQNLSIKIHDLTSEKAINMYLDQGQVNEMRFIRYGVRRDITDQYDKGAKETKGYMELVIKDHGIPIRDRLKKFFKSSNKDTKNFLAIESFPYDDVKVQFSLNKKNRTVTFSDLNKFKAYYEVSDDLTIGEDGHPTFDSLQIVSEDLLSDIVEQIEKKE